MSQNRNSSTPSSLSDYLKYGNSAGPEREKIKQEMKNRDIDRWIACAPLQPYRNEPLFDIDPAQVALLARGLPEEPGFLSRLKDKFKLHAECVHFRQRDFAPKSFAEVLEARRDDILRADRERGEELRKANREAKIKLAIEERVAEKKEEYKRARRLEDRWHQHRLAEEDRIRYEHARDFMNQYYPGVPFSHEMDSSHHNFNRRWEGFELGQIGRNNAVEPRSVIPSLAEILYPKTQNPWKSTIEPTAEDLESTQSPLIPPLVDQVHVNGAMADIQHCRNAIHHLLTFGAPQVGTERHWILRVLQERLREAERRLGQMTFEHPGEPASEVGDDQNNQVDIQEGAPLLDAAVGNDVEVEIANDEG